VRVEPADGPHECPGRDRGVGERAASLKQLAILIAIVECELGEYSIDYAQAGATKSPRE
jgi:hypothetical protein